ncbi:MAG TPA: sigma-70 family RNA polymerase sigma factor [Burkholderiaceae bacterium]|nr:sigma-70 family RNA polymerase sigma factor [Burkholderiaceae bacterium]
MIAAARDPLGGADLELTAFRRPGRAAAEPMVEGGPAGARSGEPPAEVARQAARDAAQEAAPQAVQQTAQQAEWLRAIAGRDQRAFEKLYDATLARVFALARRICVDPALAEEVVEDVYVQVWREAPRFDASRGVPLAWLLMITRSRALDALRRRDEAVATAEPHLLASEDDAAADPLQLLATFEEASATRRALESLPARERQLVALAFMRGLTHAEIAQDTGLPLGTVKTTIRRALMTLKTLLGPHAPQSNEFRNGSEHHDE